jgi:hypothetical protein
MNEYPGASVAEPPEADVVAVPLVDGRLVVGELCVPGRH